MTGLLVREMTKVELDEWRDVVVDAFAEEQIAAGNWSPGKAEERALH